MSGEAEGEPQVITGEGEGDAAAGTPDKDPSSPILPAPPSATPPSAGTPPPATPPPPASSATPASPKVGSSKIDVLLKPAGNAPIMKKKKWTVDRQKQIGWISEFIRKVINTETQESVFVYVNQSFSPSPDTEIGTLFDCFGSDGKLVIYYCRTQAWG